MSCVEIPTKWRREKGNKLGLVPIETVESSLDVTWYL